MRFPSFVVLFFFFRLYLLSRFIRMKISRAFSLRIFVGVYAGNLSHRVIVISKKTSYMGVLSSTPSARFPG